ncbi:hypothetical protein A2673_02620 [Candidatus Kaiserbacteria bacterium RIFCSPHIGHO2_01_FULL_50_13]|uniref:Transcriptional repressor n=1 Tax=Candidatus Kaiserbacteria bacterium RIFCSPLOWO2_01_FULL_50_24 TaxID=1798507 RepID=A0A1F6ER89_9BACT|nr:MAG: hypothetical protein A2673_02620 [Candidatus Kaiserbacteria bacterium RIFCSPHIGHO2_01_FULL_50_13]OGG76129.1 MAG: hypothetical protein A3A34_00900 [Candidatus Kaiserbacteria bacterium RIFCSPLOWO2_01_FULL_50_24]OGG82340.1 MAG: hypothetical protein A3H74_00020 [Candidatus Kaiserbacteria bacterium RIFCSPLOWO2_02_FULL_51_13]
MDVFYSGADRKVLQALLRDHGFRSTEGRLKLLAMLKSADEPLSSALIVGRMQNNLNRVNAYRALDALAKAGILARSDMRRGGTRYEYVRHHHHHVVCESCGYTEAMHSCDNKRLETMALTQSYKFSKINTHSMEFFGICKACAKRRI